MMLGMNLQFSLSTLLVCMTVLAVVAAVSASIPVALNDCMRASFRSAH
jgi:hypothetical protein